MTVNGLENIRKAMGWCPNANATNRVLVTLPVDDGFLSGGEGKKEMNPIKTGWANIYRNYILLQTVLGVVGFGLTFLMIKYLLQVGFNQAIILKGTIFGIIFSVFTIIYEWKQLNRINQLEVGLMKNIFLQTFSQLAIFFAVVMLLTFTIGRVDPLQFMLSLFFPSVWIHYPLVKYWERKNKKTIYLVEEKLLRWRPVALPGQT